MNDKNYELAEALVPKTYLQLAAQARHQRENLLTNLLAQNKIRKKRLPDNGWDEGSIEGVLHEIAAMDSNNFINNVGVGEREGRIASSLVAKRHYRFAHGVGRSGEITEVQPKAAGASLIAKITNYLVLDAMRVSGLRISSAIVVPLATGMALTLTLLTLKQQYDEQSLNNTNKNDKKGDNATAEEVYKGPGVVLWPRIDQKSCLKSIHTAGFIPVPVPMAMEGDELRTDLNALEQQLKDRSQATPRPCIVVMTTTSCFAPRVPDRVVEVAELCKKYGASHIINNAYGLQDGANCQRITQAIAQGRVDAVIQSTDKNFMVPVGGAVIACPSEDFINKIAKNYPGRASGTPVMDLFITLLSMGRAGYEKYLQERKEMYKYLHQQMTLVAQQFGERMLTTPRNPISIGMTLSGPYLKDSNAATMVGSMLFARNVSGVRVVTGKEKKSVAGLSFTGFGAHTDNYPSPYLTAAAAIGMTKDDVDTFIQRLKKVLTSITKKNTAAPGPSNAGGDTKGTLPPQ